MSDMRKTKTEWVLWLLPFLLAFAAFAFSLVQGWENRRHNRLTVKPHLVVDSYEANTDPMIGLKLSNQGTGLAVIMTWEIYVDNERVGSFREGWSEAVKRLKNIDHEWVSFGAMKALKSGESVPVFWVKQDKWEKLSQQNQDDFMKALKQIRLVIKYESVYEDQALLTHPG